MDAMERMPGDAEAAAAAAGMAETYGRATRPAIGDSIWFSPTVATFAREGRVIGYGTADFLVVRDPDGETFTIAPWQLKGF
jgi:streptogramin lyase